MKITVKKILISLTVLFCSGMILTSCSNFTFRNDDKTEVINIIYTNDIHVNIDSGDSNFGYDRLSYIFRKYKEENKNTVLIDTGDAIKGREDASPKDIIAIMNKVGFDVMTIGNHEFDISVGDLLELQKKARFDIVNANVVRNGKLLFNPFVIKNISGVKIAFIGLLTEETKMSIEPKNIKGLEFLAWKKSLKNYLPYLKQNADVVVLLSHIGFFAMNEEKQQNFVKSIEGVDLVIDGHAHLSGEKYVIVSGGKYFENIGVVSLEYNKKTRKIDFKNTLLKIEDYKNNHDRKTVDFIEKIKESRAEILGKVVLLLDKDIEGNSIENRIKSTPMGNMVSDAILLKTKADIAIMNGGGIRDYLKAGKVRYLDIKNVSPFDNTIVAKKMKGIDIKKGFEYSLKRYPQAFGGFLQVAGAKVFFNDKNKVEKIIFSNQKQLKDNDFYTIGMISYIAEGGDGYEILASYKNISGFGDLSEAMIKLLKHKTSFAEQRLFFKEDMK